MVFAVPILVPSTNAEIVVPDGTGTPLLDAAPIMTCGGTCCADIRLGNNIARIITARNISVLFLICDIVTMTPSRTG